jgi:hypothetical protein
MLSYREFIVRKDEACGEIPARWHDDFQRLGAKLKEGQFGTFRGQHGTYYLHRLDLITLWLTPDANSRPAAQPQSYAWAAPLWAELEVGAPTSGEREALARGMVARVPCGECRRHWKIALKEHPPQTETPEAFARWVRARRNDIARRKGRPLLPDLPD